MEELSISHTNPFFHASQAFAEAIGSNVIARASKLAVIDLSQNLLGDQAAVSLLSHLYPLPALREVSFSGNHLGDVFLSALNLTKFKSDTLRLLDLSQNTFLDGELLVSLITEAA